MKSQPKMRIATSDAQSTTTCGENLVDELVGNRTLAIAEVFTQEFKDRQVACGAMAMESLPVEVKLQNSYWKHK